MNRLYLLPLTLLALALVVWNTGLEAAQEPHPPIAEVHRITDNLHMLGSGSTTGGNIAVLIAEHGVVLVDTKNEGYGPDILEHVRRLTDKPVTTIINSHVHFDHSGSNTEFPETVQFVAHENVRRHMARADCQPIPTNCDDFQGENAKYLPATTFSDRLTLFAGGPDQIDLYYFGRGHTDGDTFIVFKEARTMHVGDMFLGKGLPFIDAENGNGGSAIEFGRTLKRAISTIKDVDTIITGHWAVRLSWGDLVEYQAFYADLYEHARRGIDAGRSAEEVIAGYVKPARFSDFSAAPTGTFSVTSVVNYIYKGV
jgi:glyoxylase-like metal-dependent hydrolase (beta-lactamase superfamily II)